MSARSKDIAAWVLYDVALHGYLLLIPSTGFALYFNAHLAAGRADSAMLWSLAVALPLILSGLAAPLIGALADTRGAHRPLLIVATLVCAVATACLALSAAGTLLAGIGLFVIAHLACLLAMALYNAYLPRVSTPGNVARISGVAWGLSYLGGIACLALCFPFIRDGIVVGEEHRFALAFVITGLFLALIGIPAAAALPAVAATRQAGAGNPYRRILETVNSWRQMPAIPRFLIGYYLINDAVVTVIYFTAVFLRETFGLPVQQVLIYSVAFQLMAIPATIFFGWLGDRWRQSAALGVTLGIWAVVLSIMSFAKGPWVPLAIVLSLGLVLGSTQSLCRSMYTRMFSADRAGEYFGFHALAGRASSALGPLLFGGVVYLTGSQRAGFASLSIFLIAGGWLLLRPDRVACRAGEPESPGQ